MFYVEQISDEGVLHNVFLQNKDQTSIGVITAQTATIEDLADGRYIIFSKGEQVKGQPGALDYAIEKFDEYAVRVDSKTAALKFNRHALSVNTLFNSSAISNKTELLRRLSIPLGALLLCIIGVPLAQISPRGGVYGNMFMGFLIYFSYGNLLRVSYSWVENNAMPLWLGATMVNLILLFLGLILLIRLTGWDWVLLNF